MKKSANIILGLFILLFLAACVAAKKRAVKINPLPAPALGAADEYALPPRQ